MGAADEVEVLVVEVEVLMVEVATVDDEEVVEDEADDEEEELDEAGAAETARNTDSLHDPPHICEASPEHFALPGLISIAKRKEKKMRRKVDLHPEASAALPLSSLSQKHSPLFSIPA